MKSMSLSSSCHWCRRGAESLHHLPDTEVEVRDVLDIGKAFYLGLKLHPCIAVSCV